MASGNEDLHRFQTSDGQRPKKRWEDEISEFLKTEETETTKGNEMKNYDTWIKVAKNRERWKAMESEYAAISVDCATHRENPPQDPIRPARYLNDDHLQQRELASYVIFNSGYLVTFKKHGLDIERADELKPIGHESLPFFSPEPPILVLNRIRGFRSEMSQQYLFLVFVFFEFRRIYHSTRVDHISRLTLCTVFSV